MLGVRITCRSCGFVEDESVSEMVRRLRDAGTLKAKSEASPEVVRELFLAAAAQIPCPDCGAVNLTARPAEPLCDEDWGQARACEACHKPIPPERLEFLPDARLCAACQQKDERGELADEREFCPRCGAVMQLVSGSGRGVSRYSMRCPACRR
ncbi:MAG: TraR/DksA C4-type zinc finger protein [Pirellulales bacterium]